MKEYFPHDGGARRDPKVLALLMKYGYRGYGIYFMILEMIFEGKLYRITEYNIKTMAFDIRIEESELVEIFEYLSSEKCELMVKKDDFYLSRRMNKTMDNIKRKSRINSENARKGHAKRKIQEQRSPGNGNPTVKKGCSENVAGVMAEENNIGYNKIVKDSIVEVKESKEEKLAKRELKFRCSVIEYNKSKDDKYPQWMIDEFLNYYTEPNKSKTKMSFELNKTWDIGRRLSTWHGRSNKFRALDSRDSNTEELKKFLNE